MENKIKVFSNAEFKNSNAFIIYNEETKSCILIDTAFGDLENISEFVEQNGFNVESIIISHSHFDHFARLDEFCVKFDKANVYITLDDLPGLFDPVLNFSSFYNSKYGSYTCKQPKNLKALMYDKIYNFNGIEFKVIHEGGHTKGSVMIDFFNEKILLSGQIMQGESASKALPEISDRPEKVKDNIRSIFAKYDSEYTIYPSHFDVCFNLGEIKSSNVTIQRILAMK